MDVTCEEKETERKERGTVVSILRLGERRKRQKKSLESQFRGVRKLNKIIFFSICVHTLLLIES